MLSLCKFCGCNGGQIRSPSKLAPFGGVYLNKLRYSTPIPRRTHPVFSILRFMFFCKSYNREWSLSACADTVKRKGLWKKFASLKLLTIVITSLREFSVKVSNYIDLLIITQRFYRFFIPFEVGGDRIDILASVLASQQIISVDQAANSGRFVRIVTDWWLFLARVNRWGGNHVICRSMDRLHLK